VAPLTSLLNMLENDVTFSLYNKEIYSPLHISPSAFKPASHLREEADHFIARQLKSGQFAALQWSMENTDISWFPTIVPAVIKATESALQHHNIPIVRFSFILRNAFLV